jgi:hypothetical protein
MLEHKKKYQQMREAAWANAHKLHSKRQFEQRLLSCICEAIPGERTST